MSLLATIRGIVRPGAEAVLDVDDDPVDETETQPLRTGAEPKEAAMAQENPAPGADIKPGIAEADHKAAVAKASADGKAEGAKAANVRMAAILGAEGVKGDGKRMAAGLDLALKSPDMEAAAVVSFVTDNVAAAAAANGQTQPKGGTYERQRLAAAELVQPNGGQPAADNPNKALLASAIDRTNKRQRR